MEIIKNRTPEYNKFAYSGGSSYGHISLDSKAALANACRNTVNSNGNYSNEKEERDEFFNESLEKFISQYPAPFAREIKPQYTKLDEDNRIVWDTFMLNDAIRDSYSFYLFQKEMDRLILNDYGFDIDTEMEQRSSILESALNMWKQRINESNG